MCGICGFAGFSDKELIKKMARVMAHRGPDQEGYQCYGCEVEPELVTIAKDFLRSQGKDAGYIQSVRGNRLPFENSTFDLITAHYVFEHVSRIGNLFREMFRVLKRGGYIYIVSPNYLCCWEVHYGLFFIPGLPGVLERCYLRMMHRDPDFLDSLTFTTPGRLE